MAQHGATSAARGETSSTGGPQGAGVHLDCLGLRQCAVRPATVPGFQRMCRVVDTPFSAVSASILFELRAHAREPVALAAFHQVCAPGGPGTAELFDRAVSLRKSDGPRCRSFHEVFVADRPLAVALDQAAQRVQAALGGLYVGKLDCLRSTLCNPALGLNPSGCCAACCAIRTEDGFNQRLRRSAHSAETGRVAGVRANKRVLSVDETRAEATSRVQQGRAGSCARARLETTRVRLKAKFDAAMEGAASVIATLRAAAQTTVSELLDSARAKEA